MAIPTSPAQTAWLRYRDTLRQRREDLLAGPFADDPQLRAQGLYYLHSLEATAYNLYVAPRQQYPTFYVQSVYMPMAELSWGEPNPDFMYHDAWIDGAHTYRVWGVRRGGVWATLQVLRGFWGDETRGDIANLDFDEVPTTAEGAFEIFLGPNPPAEPEGRLWVKLDPELHNIMLLLRETFYDWERDTPMEVHIEILDRVADAPIYFDEAELARRVELARAFFDYAWRFTTDRFPLFAKPRPPGAAFQAPHQFWDNGPSQHGGNPLAVYGHMFHDIAPDEALIIEVPQVRARYWGLQLESIWRQTTDYTYHLSSLNGTQAHVDADGRVRAVLALTDPGVPNWLDPAGLKVGFSMYRTYRAEDRRMPEVTKVKLSELRSRLAPDTPVVSAEARRAQIAARAAAVRRRWGQ